MLIEDARVVHSNGNRLWAETRGQSACSSCNQTACSSSVLSGLIKPGLTRIELENTLGAKPGDTIVIGIEDGVLVRLAVLAYLWPLVSMIGIAILARVSGVGEAGQVVAAISGLLGGFALVRAVTGHSVNKNRQPEMIKVKGQAAASVLRPFNKGK
ncbi:MAG: SoxR reducing system RseC family protein [Gammaproteobacteria bacterium]|nr:SoxR reducing system RseC family protein [Gammaproteobacteria bacterium]